MVTNCSAQYLGLLFGFLALGFIYLLCSALQLLGTEWDCVGSVRVCFWLSSLNIPKTAALLWSPGQTVVVLITLGGHFQQNTLTLLLFALVTLPCLHLSALTSRAEKVVWSAILPALADRSYCMQCIGLAAEWWIFLFLECITVFLKREWIVGHRGFYISKIAKDRGMTYNVKSPVLYIFFQLFLSPGEAIWFSGRGWTAEPTNKRKQPPLPENYFFHFVSKLQESFWYLFLFWITNQGASVYQWKSLQRRDRPIWRSSVLAWICCQGDLPPTQVSVWSCQFIRQFYKLLFFWGPLLEVPRF